MGEKLTALVFIIKSCKGIINVLVIYERFVDSFEKLSFVIADKNVSKRGAKRGTHSHAIYLPVHYIIETEFNRGTSCLHQLLKNCTRKRRQGKLDIVQSISADFNSFCEQNVNEKAADVIGAEKDRWKKVKVFTLSAKIKKLEIQWVE